MAVRREQAMENDAYEKQMLWNAARHQRNQRDALKVEAVELEECTFTPTLMSKQIRTNRRPTSPTNSAKSLKAPYERVVSGPKASLSSHIARHERARRARQVRLGMLGQGTAGGGCWQLDGEYSQVPDHCPGPFLPIICLLTRGLH